MKMFRTQNSTEEQEWDNRGKYPQQFFMKVPPDDIKHMYKKNYSGMLDDIITYDLKWKHMGIKQKFSSNSLEDRSPYIGALIMIVVFATLFILKFYFRIIP